MDRDGWVALFTEVSAHRYYLERLLPHEIAHGSLRMTLDEETTKEDVDYVVDNLKEIVAQLRSMSPLYEDFVKKQEKNKN